MGNKNSGRPRKNHPGGISALSMVISKDLHDEFKAFCIENEMSQPDIFEFLFHHYKNFDKKMEDYAEDKAIHERKK